MRPSIFLVLTSIPALAILVGLFGGGLALAVVRSLGVFPAFDMHTPTLAYFGQAIGSSWFGPSLSLTARIAALSTLVALGLGSGVAVGAALWIRPSWWLRTALQVPLYLPHIIVANMILVVFSQSGLLARILSASGVIAEMNEAPVLVYDEWGIGIALGLALKETPFVAVLVFPFAYAVVETYGSVARTLGARASTFLLRIVLPMVWPALATAGLIVFAYGFGSFEVPFVLGRTFPRTLSHAAFELYTSADPLDRPVAIALGMVIVLINVLFAVAYFSIAKRYAPLLEQIRAGKST